MILDEFIRMSSRFAAEAIEGGNRFRIYDGAGWNLLDRNHNYRGHAACFFAWEAL